MANTGDAASAEESPDGIPGPSKRDHGWELWKCIAFGSREPPEAKPEAKSWGKLGVPSPAEVPFSRSCRVSRSATRLSDGIDLI